LANSGAIIWQGPHQAAQKSITMGNGLCEMSAAKAAVLLISTGAATKGRSALQVPQRPCWLTLA